MPHHIGKPSTIFMLTERYDGKRYIAKKILTTERKQNTTAIMIIEDLLLICNENNLVSNLAKK